MENIEYVVDENGKKLAAIVPIERYEELLELAQDAIDIAMIEDVKDEPRIDWEDVKRQRLSEME